MLNEREEKGLLTLRSSEHAWQIAVIRQEILAAELWNCGAQAAYNKCLWNYNKRE